MYNEQIPGAAVTIVKDSRVLYQKGFGVKEIGKPEKVDEHTVFRLGSVSKGFASVLTGMLVEEGVVSWDDPISHYLKEFSLNDPVQIRHLLSHSTGLPRHAYTYLIEDGMSLDLIIPRFEQVPLIAQEGKFPARMRHIQSSKKYWKPKRTSPLTHCCKKNCSIR